MGVTMHRLADRLGRRGRQPPQVAKGLLKQRVWIKWPYLQEGCHPGGV